MLVVTLETCINHFLYADDMCLIASSIIGLQKLIDMCDLYCKDNVIIINIAKTKCVYFYTAKMPRIVVGTWQVIRIDGEIISCDETFKYLGHELHFQLGTLLIF